MVTQKFTVATPDTSHEQRAAPPMHGALIWQRRHVSVDARNLPKSDLHATFIWKYET